MKAWNYDEITSEAEQRINLLMTEAARRPADEASIYRQWACGVYIMWDATTLGWRNENDGFRLQRLLGPQTFPWRSNLGLPADA